MWEPVDATGERHGRLTAIKRIGKKGHDSLWEWKCDCGNTAQIKLSAVRSGNTKSCGCLRLERDAEWKETITKHGYSGTRLYTVWKQMKKRCYNKHDPVYKHYGALGVEVCDEWRNSFLAFRAWMIEHGYDENAKRGKCTIDRIDPDGNYCPENCRVVDMHVQAKNRRRRKKVDTA